MIDGRHYKLFSDVYRADLSDLNLSSAPTNVTKHPLPDMHTSFGSVPSRCNARDYPLEYVSSSATEYVTNNYAALNLTSNDPVTLYSGEKTGSISDFSEQTSILLPELSEIRNIRFSDTGNRLFVLGQRVSGEQDNFEIHQYQLQTPFDLSNLVYSGSMDFKPYSGSPVEASASDIRDFHFSNNGLTLSVLVKTDRYAQFALSQPYNVVNGLGNPPAIASTNKSGGCMVFNDTQDTLYTASEGSTNVLQYSLSTPGDIGTSTFVQEFDLTTGITDFAFSSDGLKIFVLHRNNTNIIEFTLDAPYSLSAATFSHNMSINDDVYNPYSIAVNDTGTKLFVTSKNPKGIVEYALSSTNTLSSATFTQLHQFRSLNSARYPDINGVRFSPNGTYMYVLLSDSPLLLVYQLSEAFNPSSCTLRHVLQLNINASSFAFDISGTKLFVKDRYEQEIITYFSDEPWLLIPANMRPGATASFIANSERRISYSLTNNYYYSNSIEFNNSGTIMYLANRGSRGETEMRGWLVREPYDIWTSDRANYDQSSEDLSMFSINNFRFNNDGSRLFVSSRDDTNKVYEYILPDPFDISTASLNSIITAWNDNKQVSSLALSNDGKTMFVGSNDTSASTASIYVYTSNKSLHAPVLTPEYNVPLVADPYVANVGDDIGIEIAGRFGVAGQDSEPVSVSFSASGDKMFVLGKTTSTVYQYSLPVAFDVSSAIYNKKRFSVQLDAVDENEVPVSLTFSPDGLTMFVLSSKFSTIYQYTLTEAFEVATASLDAHSSNSMGSPTAGPVFNTDGTKAILAFANNILFQLTLSTPYDIDTATGAPEGIPEITKNIPAVNVISGILVNPSGTKIFILSNDNSGSILQYTMTTPFDITSITDTPAKTLLLTDHDSNKDLVSLVANTDLSSIFVLSSSTDIADDTVLQYSLPDPGDISSATFSNKSFKVGGQGLPIGFVFDNTGTKMFVVAAPSTTGQGGNFSIFQYAVDTPYDITNGVTYSGISCSLDLPEWQGLLSITFNNDGSEIYIINSDTSSAFQYALGSPYDIQELESLTSDPGSNSWLLVNMEVESNVKGNKIKFSNDGTIAYVISSQDTLYTVTLSTPWDITSNAGLAYSQVQFNSLNSGLSINGQLADIEISENGEYLWALTIGQNAGIHSFRLFSPHDLASISSLDFYPGPTYDSQLTSLVVHNNQDFYVSGAITSYIYQYSTIQDEAVVLTFDFAGFDPLLIEIPDRSVQHTEVDSYEWVDNNLQVKYTPVTDVGRALQYKFVLHPKCKINEARYDLTKTAPGIRDTRGL